jgi:hypothetical protein
MMKKFLILTPMVLLLAALFVAGCGDDKESSPLTPGDPEDPGFVIVAEQLQGIDGMTSGMLGTTLNIVDLVMNQQPAAKPGAYTLEYHEASGYWYYEESYTEGEGSEFTVIDSVQFREGVNVAQYPDPELLTQVNSYLTLTGTTTGDGVNAVLHQNIVITSPTPASDTLIINGNGDIDASYSFTEYMDTDSTVCSGDLNLQMNITNISLDMTQQLETELSCPYAGSVVYSGSIYAQCSGGGADGLATGSWSITQVFDEGMMAVTVISGGNSWSMTEQCN